MKSILMIAAGTFVLAACAYNPESGKGGVYANQHTYIADNGEEMICERQDVPGSIFPDRVCMSVEAWERQKQAAKDATGDVHRKGLATPAPGQGG